MLLKTAVMMLGRRKRRRRKKLVAEDPEADLLKGEDTEVHRKRIIAKDHHLDGKDRLLILLHVEDKDPHLHKDAEGHHQVLHQDAEDHHLRQEGEDHHQILHQDAEDHHQILHQDAEDHHQILHQDAEDLHLHPVLREKQAPLLPGRKQAWI